MPPIPRIAADRNLAVAPRVQHETVQQPLSNYTATAEGAAQLGEVGAKIGDELLQRQVKLQQSTQYNQLSSEAYLAIDSSLRQQEQTPYDFADPQQYDAYIKATSAGIDKIVSQTLGKVKDPEVKARLQANLLNESDSAIVRSRTYARTQVLDAGKAQLTRSIDADTNRAIDAAEGNDFNAALETALARISDASQVGLISDVEQEKLREATINQIETVRTERLIQSDPKAALQHLQSTGLPDGMVTVGNIDVNHRPVINNADGSHSTIFSATIPLDKNGNVWKGKYEDAPQYALVPTIADGKFFTSDGKLPKELQKTSTATQDQKDAASGALEDAAAEHYQATKEHLGIFKSADAANSFAEATHTWVADGTDAKVFLPPGAKTTGALTMDPIKREEMTIRATNAVATQAKQQVEAQKEAADRAYAFAIPQALNGQLAHSDVDSLQKQFPYMSGQNVEHLHDLINKPVQEAPSDRKALSDATVAVNVSPFRINQTELYQMYLNGQAGKPGLNLSDFTRLNDKLRENLKSAAADDSATGKRKALAMQQLEGRLGADPNIKENAIVELANSPAYARGVGDPVDAALEIAKKYQPDIDRLGGKTSAQALNDFESARTKYLNERINQSNWTAEHYIKKHLPYGGENPNDEKVDQAQIELLNAARVAKRDLGSAGDAVEGTRKAVPPELGGGTSIVIGGRIIKE